MSVRRTDCRRAFRNQFGLLEKKMIELREITWDNFDECSCIKLSEEQKNYVASPDYSLAQAYVSSLCDEKPLIPFAIYSGDTVVGFAMMGYETSEENDFDDEPCYFVCRFMIDEKFQGRGLGKQAMIKVLEHIRTFPHGEAGLVYLSYDEDNKVARKLYKSLGFVETGEIVDDELVARLVL